MIINLPVRYWPKCPRPDVDLSQYNEKILQYGQTTLEIEAEETAFVLVDCWNITRDGPSLVPGLAKYWDYNFIAGGASWLERDEEIVQTKILPCLTRARELNVAVVHAPTSYIADRYPQYQRLAAMVEEPPVGIPRSWPPAEFVSERWRQFMTLRYGENCEDAWNQIRSVVDIAEPLQPLEHEHVVSTLAQLDYILRERRILNVLFVGFAANACLLLKPDSVTNVSNCGYQVVVMRDCTTAIEAPWSVENLYATRSTMDYIEMAFGYTTTSEEFLSASNFKR